MLNVEIISLFHFIILSSSYPFYKLKKFNYFHQKKFHFKFSTGKKKIEKKQQNNKAKLA